MFVPRLDASEKRPIRDPGTCTGTRQVPPGPCCRGLARRPACGCSLENVLDDDDDETKKKNNNYVSDVNILTGSFELRKHNDYDSNKNVNK